VVAVVVFGAPFFRRLQSRPRRRLPSALRGPQERPTALAVPVVILLLVGHFLPLLAGAVVRLVKVQPTLVEAAAAEPDLRETLEPAARRDLVAHLGVALEALLLAV
jgi:hypothetical protein